MNGARRRDAPSKVHVCFCSGGQPDFNFTMSLAMFIQRDRDLPVGQRRLSFNAFESGPRIASSRNKLVRHFLEFDPNAEWLLMVDDDMVFSYDHLEKLLEVADPKTRPIVSGLYFSGSTTEVFPVMGRALDPKENDGQFFENIRDWPEDEVIPVDSAGCGFLLIHRTVLERLKELCNEPWVWFQESNQGIHEFGEDATFCIRAAFAGFPTFVHTGVQLGHMKRVMFTAAMYHASVAARSVAAEAV